MGAPPTGLGGALVTNNFYRATHMHSADYAVARCLSVKVTEWITYIRPRQYVALPRLTYLLPRVTGSCSSDSTVDSNSPFTGHCTAHDSALLSRRSRQQERLSASVLSICSFVCLFVCLSPKCKKARFSQKLSNLELWYLLTTYRKSHMGFSKNPLREV